MSRRLRLEYPGAIYHVRNEGDGRQRVFAGREDYEMFLETLGQACEKTGWLIHAYCLVPDHAHLVLETPEPNLSVGMKWLWGTYTLRFNRRHRLAGHLFRGRFHSCLVGDRGGYVRDLADYVHLNPDRAGLVDAASCLSRYEWSSLRFYASDKRRPTWLTVRRVMGECGEVSDDAAGRAAFLRRMNARREEKGKRWHAMLRRAWCHGDDAFRAGVLERIGQLSGPWHHGPERRAAAQSQADRLVAEELARRGWTEAELDRRRKGDPDKVALARRLRRETTVTIEWIAHRLRMGTRGHVTHLLYWADRGDASGGVEGLGRVEAASRKGGRVARGGLTAGRRGAGRKARRVSAIDAKPEGMRERAGGMVTAQEGGFDTDWFDPRFD